VLRKSARQPAIPSGMQPHIHSERLLFERDDLYGAADLATLAAKPVAFWPTQSLRVVSGAS